MIRLYSQYKMSFGIGYLVGSVPFFCPELLEIVKNRLQFVLPVPPGDRIGCARPGVLRRDGQQFAAIPLVRDLEL